MTDYKSLEEVERLLKAKLQSSRRKLLLFRSDIIFALTGVQYNHKTLPNLLRHLVDCDSLMARSEIVPICTKHLQNRRRGVLLQLEHHKFNSITVQEWRQRWEMPKDCTCDWTMEDCARQWYLNNNSDSDVNAENVCDEEGIGGGVALGIRTALPRSPSISNEVELDCVTEFTGNCEATADERVSGGNCEMTVERRGSACEGRAERSKANDGRSCPTTIRSTMRSTVESSAIATDTAAEYVPIGSDDSDDGSGERVRTTRRLKKQQVLFCSEVIQNAFDVIVTNARRGATFRCPKSIDGKECKGDMTLALTTVKGAACKFQWCCNKCNKFTESDEFPALRNFTKIIPKSGKQKDKKTPEHKLYSKLKKLNLRVCAAAFTSGVHPQQLVKFQSESGMKPFSRTTISNYWDEIGSAIEKLAASHGTHVRCDTKKRMGVAKLLREISVTYLLDKKGNPCKWAPPGEEPEGATRHNGTICCGKFLLDRCGSKRGTAAASTAGLVICIGIPIVTDGRIEWETKVESVLNSNTYCGKCVAALMSEDFTEQLKKGQKLHRGDCSRTSNKGGGESEVFLAGSWSVNMLNPKRMKNDVVFFPESLCLDGHAQTFFEVQRVASNAMKFFYGITPGEMCEQQLDTHLLPSVGHLMKGLSKSLRVAKYKVRLVNHICSYLQSNIRAGRRLLQDTLQHRIQQGKPTDVESVLQSPTVRNLVRRVGDINRVVVSHVQDDHSECVPHVCSVARFAFEASESATWGDFCELDDEKRESFIQTGAGLSRNEKMNSTKNCAAAMTSICDSDCEGSDSNNDDTLLDDKRLALDLESVKWILSKIDQHLNHAESGRTLLGLDTQRCESFNSMIIRYTHGKQVHFSSPKRWLHCALWCLLCMNLSRERALECLHEKLGLGPPNDPTLRTRKSFTVNSEKDRKRKGTDSYRRDRANKVRKRAHIVE